MVEVSYRIEDGDTIFEHIYINKFRVRKPAKRPDTQPPSRIEMLAAAARESASLASVRALPRAEGIALVARAYARNTTLVDSAKATSNSIKVYWKGGGTEYFSVGPEGKSPLAVRTSKNVVRYAYLLLAQLRLDSAVLCGAGDFFVPQAQRDELLTELEDLRNGGTGPRRFLKHAPMQVLVCESKPISPEEDPGH